MSFLFRATMSGPMRRRRFVMLETSSLDHVVASPVILRPCSPWRVVNEAVVSARMGGAFSTSEIPATSLSPSAAVRSTNVLNYVGQRGALDPNHSPQRSLKVQQYKHLPPKSILYAFFPSVAALHSWTVCLSYITASAQLMTGG